MTIDGGLIKKSYCIGDIVWYDNNHNGIQDADETGVEGVLIILNETGAKVITNSRGEYKFCNLESGNYSITIDKSTLPDNYIITSENIGDNDSLDSDTRPKYWKK